jgi:hypothetical protein
MSMPKEWTDKIKAQEQQKEQQKKLEADTIHNLPKEIEQQQQQQKQQKHTDKEPMLNVGEKILWKFDCLKISISPIRKIWVDKKNGVLTLIRYDPDIETRFFIKMGPLTDLKERGLIGQ